jgi:hypothetical protein
MEEFVIVLIKSKFSFRFNKLIFFRNKSVDPIFYSPDNSVKFDISSLIFGDTVLEVLHHNAEENKFKQLFLIQFHTFFITENGIRFSKDMLDGICKDIRYPDEFFIDLLFDDYKTTQISTYEDEVSKWKNIISDFILKGYKNLSIGNNLENNSNSNSNSNEALNNKERNDKAEKIENEKIQKNLNTLELEKDDEFTSKPNTENKAQEILQKFAASNKSKEDSLSEEEDEEEDIENYLKNLENK